MSKIIKPEGIELMKYLSEGYAICNKCGAIMDRKEAPKGGNDIYACPSCDWSVDVMEYEYEDSEEEELTEEVLKAYKGDVPPAGCRACGGPYPQCKTSCKMFDD